MDNRLYTFYNKDHELIFYENYVESKYEVFTSISFYKTYKKAEVKGNKLILFHENGKKNKYALRGENIQFLDSICQHVNKVIEKEGTPKALAYSKENKKEEYKISFSKNNTVIAYDNYGILINSKGKSQEFFYNDIIGTFLSPPVGIITGDLAISLSNNGERVSFSYKKSEADMLKCLYNYIIEQACKLKANNFAPSSEKQNEEPKAQPTYAYHQPTEKPEPTVKEDLFASYSEVSKPKEQSYVATADILKLKELYDQGIITEEEFTKKKRQLLGI